MIYVIAASMRTGTHLLADMLRQAGAGSPEEFLQPRPDWPLQRYAEEIANAHKDQDVIGFTAFWGQLGGLSDDAAHSLDVILQCLGDDDVRLIHLYRRDVVAQAASVERAKQTGQWHAKSGVEVISHSLEYRPEAMQELIDLFNHENRGWLSYFEDHPYPTYTLTYETLSAIPQTCCDCVLGFLGLPVVPDINPCYTKLAGKETEYLAQQYRASKRA